MLVHELLSGSAARAPLQVALIVGESVYSFAEIDRQSDCFAAALQRFGVGRGDRVAAILENSAELVVALWGALKAGAVFVPINHGTRADKLAWILGDAAARCLVAPAALHERVEAAAARVPMLEKVVWVGAPPRADGLSFTGLAAGSPVRPADPRLIDLDLCLILYTSGSTGRPKGVMMTHRTVRNNAWSISTYLGNTPDDVVLCVLPLSFGYGLFQVLAAAWVGFAVVLERSFAFPYEMLRRIEQRRVTGLPAVPTIFATLLQFAPFSGLDLSSLRYLTNAAAAMPPAHIGRLRQLLPEARFFSMYGLTECTRVSFLDPARIDAKPDSVGRAIPNFEAFVVDEAGRRLGPGAVGELVVRGTGLMLGYWRQPEATARVLRRGEDGDLRLHTGDLFTTDEDGDLYFVARRDEVFTCRGAKVSPREVESVLFELDDVAEAAVIGVPDPQDGMAVKAFIRVREGRVLDEQVLRRHCRKRLEPQLVPRFVEFCSELPKTDSGKISKVPLRTGLPQPP